MSTLGAPSQDRRAIRPQCGGVTASGDWAARVALAVLFVLGAACSSETLPGEKNVVLISIDSLRADHLGCYGHRPEFAPDQAQSPHIDSLAKRGVVFESAWSTSSWTLPAHMSLLTGLGAALHEVETDGRRLDPLRETLAERFQASGWATGGVYSGPYLSPRYGFDRGFDRYDSAMVPEEEIERLIEEERERRAKSGEPLPSEEEVRTFRARFSNWAVTSAQVTARAEEFLELVSDRPFFLFLHYFDVHYDYLPDAAVPGLAECFDPEYAGDFDGRNWYFDPRVRELQPPFTRRIAERDLRHVMALYDAEIQWVDHHVGRVVSALERLGLDDRTIVAVVSDHGDEFFEHDGIGHRNTLFTEVQRVPVVLSLPGREHAGRRVLDPIGLQELAPTLLDFAGAAPLREAQGEGLRALLEGRGDEPRSVFGRLYDPAPWFLNLRESWRDERFSVVRHFELVGGAAQQVRDLASDQPIFHVFDRSQDPLERSAVRPTDPRYAQAVERYAAAWDLQQAAALALERSPAATWVLVDEDPHQRAQLEGLGYTAGAAGSGMPQGRLVLPRPGE